MEIWFVMHLCILMLWLQETLKYQNVLLIILTFKKQNIKYGRVYLGTLSGVETSM